MHVTRLKTPCQLCGWAQDLMQLFVFGTTAHASWVCVNLGCPYAGALVWDLSFDPELFQ